MVSNKLLVISIIYRTLALVLGGLMIYGGYKLFVKGYSAPAGNLSANSGNQNISLVNAAPGTFLFVLGALLCLGSIFKGVDLKANIKKNVQSDSLSIQPLTETILTEKTGLQLNVDSIYSLAQDRISKKKYLDALKYLYLAKGALFNQDEKDSLRNVINNKIRETEKSINNVLAKPKINLNSEEYESVSIGDDLEDSLKSDTN